MTNGTATISYHGRDRRDSRIIPLQSYGNPPPESKFDGLDYFDFRLTDVSCSSPNVTPLITYPLLAVRRTIKFHHLSLQNLSSTRENNRAKACHRRTSPHRICVTRREHRHFSTKRSSIPAIVILSTISSCTNASRAPSSMTITCPTVRAMSSPRRYKRAPRTSPAAGLWVAMR